MWNICSYCGFSKKKKIIIASTLLQRKYFYSKKNSKHISICFMQWKWDYISSSSSICKAFEKKQTWREFPRNSCYKMYRNLVEGSILNLSIRHSKENYFQLPHVILENNALTDKPYHSPNKSMQQYKSQRSTWMLATKLKQDLGGEERVFLSAMIFYFQEESKL